MAFFQLLVGESRFFEAAMLLRAADVSLAASDVVAREKDVGAIVQLALHGGAVGGSAVAEAFSRGANDDNAWSVERVVGALNGAACRRYMRALSLHAVKETVQPFRLMCTLPQMHVQQRETIVACYGAALDRADTKQRLVQERISRLVIRDIVSLPERHTIMSTIGTTAHLDVLSALLLEAALASAYPALGDELLHATLCRARWPIVACLSRDLETVFAPTLTKWFLAPELRSDFSEIAMNWLKIAIAFEADQHGEPPESFADD